METVTSHLPFIRIEIPDALDAKIRAFQPEYLDRKGFLCLVLDQALDTPVTIPAYRVGAGERAPESQQLSPQQPSLQSEAVVFSAVPDTFTNPLVGRLEEKGGSGGKEEKGETTSKNLKPIPDDLRQHEELIREFWKVKKGSRNSRAWSLLLTELSKIQTEFSSERAAEQLTLAINGLWKGITINNMQRFEPAKKSWQQEPDTKHPAHRDFTAERLAEERKQREEEEKHNFLGF